MNPIYRALTVFSIAAMCVCGIPVAGILSSASTPPRADISAASQPMPTVTATFTPSPTATVTPTPLPTVIATATPDYMCVGEWVWIKSNEGYCKIN